MTRDEFIDKSYKVIKQSMSFTEIAKKEGFLAFDKELVSVEIEDDRDIFIYGLRLVIDENDKEFINKVLTNLIDHEKDEYSRRLKFIKKEAVLMIQECINIKEITIMLLSYLDEEEASILLEKYIFNRSSDAVISEDLDLEL